MSTRYYLPLNHEEVAKTVLKSHLKTFYPSKEIKFPSEPEYIYEKEYWWNVLVKTATKVPHNKPDLIIWNRETKICSITEFSCPLDISINKKVNEKLESYGQLVRNLCTQIISFKLHLLLLVGTMSSVPKCLTNCLKGAEATCVEIATETKNALD